MLINGKCHCGNIAFELEWKGDAAEIPARACGCSFCVKHAGVWTANPAGILRVRIRDATRVSRYAFGTKTAEFLVCAVCGVVPLVTSEIESRLYAVVSVHALDGVDPSLLRHGEANFDGEGVDSRLERRKRHWIGDVEIVEGESE